jgi:hypothetical protein
MGRQRGFFDVEDRLRELSAKGDDLERIAALVDFEKFRSDLERAVSRSDGAKGGRPAFDHVLMFKVLLLQAMHAPTPGRAYSKPGPTHEIPIASALLDEGRSSLPEVGESGAWPSSSWSGISRRLRIHAVAARSSTAWWTSW